MRRRRRPRIREAPILGVYVAAVSTLGLGMLLLLVGMVGLADVQRAPQVFWLLAAFAFLGELFPVKLKRQDEEEEITTSTTFVFAIQLSIGTVPAVVTQAVSSFIGDVRARKPLWKAGFNIAQTTLSLVAAGAVLTRLTHAPRAGTPVHVAPSDLPGILAAAAVYFLVNNGLMGVALAFAQRVPVLTYLWGDLAFQATTAGVLLALAPAVVVVTDFSLLLIPLLALPVAAVYRSANASLENARLVTKLEHSLRQLAQQSARNRHQALHDALTGLPNRTLFRDRARQAVRVARRADGSVGVMIMDLDRFKEINDTLGHHHGDLLLQQVGARLQGILRESDTLARLGGDEFGLLLPDVRGRTGAAEVAERILRSLETPFVVDGIALEVGATIGIALFPDHGTEADRLMQRADVAMYAGKAAHTGYELYDRDKDRYSPSRLSLAGRLRRGLDDGELRLHFQPQADLRTGEVPAAEALVRWDHPARGLLPPGEFLPLAEHTGLIKPLTSFVLDTALGTCRALRLRGFNLTVGVNLSARNLADVGLPEEVSDLLTKWMVPPAALELEITETSIMADPARAVEVLHRLRALGVGISIDDFGTGYSSLALLRQLPVDAIKIDRSFVGNMAHQNDDAVIVRSTIDLARNLGLRVVAEGVETREIWGRLRALGCDLAQGYFVAKPIAPEELEAWLQSASRGHLTPGPEALADGPAPGRETRTKDRPSGAPVLGGPAAAS